MDTLVSPSRTITIGSKAFVLDGSFATLRAVQEAFRLDVVQILISVMEMRTDQIALLIAIGSGQRDKLDEIGQAIFDAVGAISKEYGTLKTEVFAWLNIVIAPKADREKKSGEMDALLTARQPSPGQNTNPSPLAPVLDGRPVNSGEATSGS